MAAVDVEEDEPGPHSASTMSELKKHLAIAEETGQVFTLLLFEDSSKGSAFGRRARLSKATEGCYVLRYIFCPRDDSCEIWKHFGKEVSAEHRENDLIIVVNTKGEVQPMGRVYSLAEREIKRTVVHFKALAM